MSEEYDALCIGAHPDDVEIGMGGTIAQAIARGARIVIVDLTNGEPTPHGTPERRAAESARAAEVLGVERVTLELPNRYLFDTREAREALAEVIRAYRPRTVFAPYPTDAHPDHIAASSIATAARFYAKLTKTSMAHDPFYPPRMYRYMAVHLRLIAEPSFIVALDEVALATKLEALASYASQFGENPVNSGVIGLMEQTARMWGGLARCDAGEPFFALEPIAVRSVDDLV